MEPQTLDTNMAFYNRFVCRDKPEGFLVASVSSCSEYYICRHGEPVRASCGDKYFNALTGYCDLPENTGCVQAANTDEKVLLKKKKKTLKPRKQAAEFN